MVSIWPVAAINKIKSKRKDLIKENDIKRSIKSRKKNANIHFFFQIFPLLRPKHNKVLKPLAEYFMEGHLQRAGVEQVDLWMSDHRKDAAKYRERDG